MSRLCCLAACFAVVALASPAGAQDYPSRPVKAIVAVGASGTGDIFMRVLGEELHRRWGQPVVVENRPGGASNIGARACAEAAPDGYTICIMPGEPLAYNQFLYKKLSFTLPRISSRSSICSSTRRRWESTPPSRGRRWMNWWRYRRRRREP